jgi:Cu/Ag efflux protein CusF
MKKITAILSAAVFAGGMATAALAHDEGGAGGEPTMRGTVSKIDHETGKIELKTDMGTAQVYFAPQAVKNLKEGDQVSLELETAKNHGKERRESKK